MQNQTVFFLVLSRSFSRSTVRAQSSRSSIVRAQLSRAQLSARRGPTTSPFILLSRRPYRFVCFARGLGLKFEFGLGFYRSDRGTVVSRNSTRIYHVCLSQISTSSSVGVARKIIGLRDRPKIFDLPTNPIVFRVKV